MKIPYRSSYLSDSAPHFRAYALALLLVVPLTLRAQSAPDEKQKPVVDMGETIELPSFTVTAEKAPRPIQEVPLAVVAIDDRKVKDYNIFSTSDIQSVSAGLDINSTNTRTTLPSMRGVVFNPDSGASAAVDVYWNEMATSYGFLAMFDMDQIEVVKGPQGTLRGRSSPAGAILLNTRRPKYGSFEANLRQTFSARSLWNTQAAVNLPLYKDKLAFRIAGMYDSNQVTGAHNVITGLDASSHTRGFRGTLGFKPTEGVEFTFVHQYLRRVTYDPAMMAGTTQWYGVQTSGTTTDDWGVKPQSLTPWDRVAVTPGPANYDLRIMFDTLSATIRLPGRHELAAIIGAQNNSQDILNETMNLSDLIPNFVGPQSVNSKNRVQSYELRFSSLRHERWNYIFGGYYEKYNNYSLVQQSPSSYRFGPTFSSTSTSPIPIQPRVSPALAMNLTSSGHGSYKGVFTTQTINFTKALKFEAGMRVQQVESKGGQRDPGLRLDSPNGYKETPITGSASLSDQITKSALVYLSYGRSYRPPGNNFRTSSSEPESLLKYKAETSNGFELGAKTSWLNRRLQINTALFYQVFKGFINQAPQSVYASATPGGAATTTYPLAFNADAEVKGFELGISAALPHRFILSVDGSYADGRYTGGSIPATTFDAAGNPYINNPDDYVSRINPKGGVLGTTPRATISTTLEWSKNIGKNEFFARGLLYYKGAREIPAVTVPDVGGYTTTDLYVGLRNDKSKWSLTLWAKNAFDRRAVTLYESPQFRGGIWNAGFYRVFVLPQREVGVTFAYSF